MVLTANVRKDLLVKLKSKEDASDQRQKLFYKNENKSFDVYKIPLDWLIYNRNNGRLEAEILTWQKEHSTSADHYDDALHSVIERLLWESNVGRNLQTLEDLERKQQQRPGIVSLDGVIIDGNRRAMLLRRLEKKHSDTRYFDAIILPDAYDENQGEIVRLETQYQVGEDSKVEYGPIQKYLHARRLHVDYGIPIHEIDQLMNADKGNTKRLLEIMALMDAYLDHIGCPGLYTMLRDSDGTREGMFVDLHSDLRRLQGGQARVPWSFDPQVDPLLLQVIQFDYIRLYDFADAKKSYREISHQSKDKNFFAQKEIWEKFRDTHQSTVGAATVEMGTLDEYIAKNPGIPSRVDAARARDKEWKEKVKPDMAANFGKSSSKLTVKVSELRPREYLERARDYLAKIDIDSPGFLQDADNAEVVMDINRMSFEMKKKLERALKK